jgi:hypothetical protein
MIEGWHHPRPLSNFLEKPFCGERGLTHQSRSTPGYETLTDILEVVQKNAWELFRDLQIFNRFSGHMRRKCVESLGTIGLGLDPVSPPSH